MRTAALVITVSACVLASGCSASSSFSQLGSKVEQHAVTAGNVMTQVRGPLPARAAALKITGQTPDTTIQAIAAKGSTWGGVVTLKIDVTDHNGSFGTAQHVIRCFTYRFAYPRNPDYGTPHPLKCGQRPPLVLTSPPLPPDGVDARTRTAVQKALSTLPPTRRGDSDAVKAALAHALGPDYLIEGGSQHGGSFAWVRYGDQCLTAQTSPTEQRVSQPRNGVNCYGG